MVDKQVPSGDNKEQMIYTYAGLAPWPATTIGRIREDWEMTTRITADFAIVSWHEEIYDQPEEGSTLLHATIQKSYQGAVDGTGVARLLMVRAGDNGGEGYLGSERVTARLGERATISS